MKKFFYSQIVLFLAFSFATISCSKETPSGDGGVIIEDPTATVELKASEKTSPISVSFYVELSGTTSYVEVYDGEGMNGNAKTIKYTQWVTYNDLDPSSEYFFTIVPYNKEGKTGKSQIIKLKTDVVPYENFFYYDDEYFEVTSVSTSVDRHQGNANWKNLRINTSKTLEFVLFTWNCPYYEGIDSYWADGTYDIQESGNFYDYIGWFNNGSGLQSAEGTLTIKSLSIGRLFTFKLFNRGKTLIGRVLTKK